MYYIKRLIEYIKYWLYLEFPLGKKIYLMGTPHHGNLGDSAIALAELKFLEKYICKKYQIKEITILEYEKFKRVIKIAISRNVLICLQGGGNMGDVWFAEEQQRRDILQEYKNQKIVVFPQTIDYSHTLKGEVERKKSVDIYNNCNKLTLCAREEISYEEMCNLYTKANVILAPDIVLTTEISDYAVKKQNKNYILICFRNDKERSLALEDKEKLLEFLFKSGLELKYTDMEIPGLVDKNERYMIVSNKMQEFCSAKLVVTDRLHAMIFSLLTGTPCVVFSNSNHKIKGVYKWLSDFEYITFCKNIQDAMEKADEYITENKVYKYESGQLQKYYTQLINSILLFM